ncbi:MAG: hypothetical protein H7841_11200 [Magnetospirillum sp. WYHS-4]
MERPLPLRPEVLVPTAALAAMALALAWPTDSWVLDTDGYQRLNRVVQLLEGGGWYDAVFHRSNPPDGEVLHWTRPLDALLALFALPLLPFVSAREALLWSSPVAILVQGWIGVAAFVWALRPFVPSKSLGYAGLLFAVQPAIFGRAFMPNQPDHHGLLILLFAFLLGAALRIAAGKAMDRTAFLGGLAGGLSLWVSPETLAPLAVFTGLAGLAWLREGRRELARDMVLLWSGLTLAVAVSLPLERPPADLGAVEFDRLSLPHLGLAVAGTLGWFALARAPALGTRGRIALALSLGGAAGLVLHLAFPGVLLGPLAMTDKWFAAIYNAATPENLPLVSRSGFDAGPAAYALGLPTAGLAILAWRAVRQPTGPWGEFWVLLALLPFAIMGAAMVRWAIYAEVLAAAVVLVALGARLTDRPSVRGLVLLAAAMGPVLAGAVLDGLRWGTPPARPFGCDVGPVLPILNGAFGERQRTILADGEGPRLLFDSPHRVVTIGFHRDAPRVMAIWRALAAPDDGPLRILARDRGAELLLICPGQDNPLAPPAPPALAARLADETPAWLWRIEIPGAGPRGYRLFEVRKP